MVIEQTIIEYLNDELDVNVMAEKPDTLPSSFCLVEKLSGGYTNRINSARIAVQSYASTLAEASKLDEEVRVVMRGIVRLERIGGARLENSYNFTDTSEKKYRYQSVFELRYYE